MRASEFINETGGTGRVVKGVNTTPDVGPNEITKQAAKFKIRVNKDGYPPVARSDGKTTKLESANIKEDNKWLKAGAVAAALAGTGTGDADHAQISSQIGQNQANYDAAIDADIDKLGSQVQQAGGMVNKFAKGVDSMSGTTAVDTPPGPPPMVEPTFVPKDSQWFVDAKAKWLETNPSVSQINKFNKTISYWNKEVAANGRSIRMKAVQEIANWLRDPSNAGIGFNKSKL